MRLAGAVTLALLASIALAAPGDVDPTFGEFGVAKLPIPTSALAVQADGKLLIAGAKNGQAVAARLDARGSPDPDFANGGIAIVPLSTGSAQGVALVLQTDGKIVVAGSTRNDSNGQALAFVARFQRNGTIDTGFGTDGTVVTSILPPVPSGDFNRVDLIGVAIQPDGKIVLSGTAQTVTTRVHFLRRYDLDGSPDPTFRHTQQDGHFPTAAPVALADGKLLSVGTYRRPDGSALAVAIRFDSHGTVDASFGNGGLAPLPFGPSQALEQPDGRIVVAMGHDGVPGLRVARLAPDGALDDSFGSSGVVVTAFGGCARPVSGRIDPCPHERTAIALQPDGRLVQTGVAIDGTGAKVPAIVRYLPDGSLDDSFGVHGRAVGDRRSGGEIAAIDPDRMRLYFAYGSSAAAGRILLATTPGTMEIESSRNPAAEGEAVTIVANVTGQSPTGSVTFLVDGNPIPACTGVSLAVVDATRGTASCVTTFVEGSRLVTAAYLGNPTNTPRLSPLLVQFAGQPAETFVAEYFNAVTGGYFLTADPAEMATLATDGSWLPTGESLRVFAARAAKTATLCRYFSGSGFAPNSSHFFGTTPAECRLVTPWMYEGEVLPVMFPDFEGRCAGGTLPLYRVYNGAQGGVPHHRYTNDPAVRQAMIAQGWVAEGSGIGIVACTAARP